MKNGKEMEVLQNMFRTLEMFKRELIGRQNNKTRECRKIVCKGQKGDRGPRGPKGDIGYTKYAGAVTKAEKGQKGDTGPRGLPGPSLEKPSIVERPADVTGREGDSALFTCNSRGNPKPDLSWTVNGKAIKNTDERIKMVGNGRLQITNLQASDSGTVGCTAKNFFGEVSATAELNVNSK